MAANPPTVVTITFVREDNRAKTFIYQDAPAYRPYGDYDTLGNHEVLELLSVLGLAQEAAEALLEQILQQKTLRQQFKLGAEQEAQVRKQFFPAKW
jgi:hypothetical protein